VLGDFLNIRRACAKADLVAKLVRRLWPENCVGSGPAALSLLSITDWGLVMPTGIAVNLSVWQTQIEVGVGKVPLAATVTA